VSNWPATAVDNGFGCQLPATGPETVVEPTGAYGLGAEVADALEKSAVGGDKDDAASGRRGRHCSGDCAAPPPLRTGRGSAGSSAASG